MAQPPKIDKPPSPNLVGSFVKGFVGGANAPDANSAQVVGDVVGALLPGLGEVKAAQDIWEGTKKGDPIQLVGGLIGLIPVVGAAGKAGSKVVEKVGKRAAKEGITNASLHFSRVAARAARSSLKNPKTQQKLAKAAEGAGQAALLRLVSQLGDMRAKGEAPEVIAREHGSFVDARKAAFEGIGEAPNASWHDLSAPSADGTERVVGRHQMGEKGYRVVPPAEGNASDSIMQLYWWKGGAEDQKLVFGIEQCPTSTDEAQAILRAFDNRKRSFRSTKSA